QHLLTDELESLIKRDILSTAKIYEVGNLTTSAADKFLQEHLHIRNIDLPEDDNPAPVKRRSYFWPFGGSTVPQPIGEERKAHEASIRLRVREIMGTRLTDLMRVCEEIAKTNRDIASVLDEELAEAVAEVSNTLTTLRHGVAPAGVPRGVVGRVHRNTPLTPSAHCDSCAALKSKTPGSSSWSWWGWIGGSAEAALLRRKKYQLFKVLDRVSALECEPTRTLAGSVRSGKFWDEARNLGVSDLMDQLLEKELITVDGQFSSDLLRHAYRKFRGLAI
ncbi:hypothetical protein HDU76_003834, partial [Blyttiomyces sp. JEL0837]